MQFTSLSLLIIVFFWNALFFDAVQPRQAPQASSLARRYLDDNQGWSESGKLVPRGAPPVVPHPEPAPVDPDHPGTGSGDGGNGGGGTGVGTGANPHDGTSGGGTDDGITAGSQQGDSGLASGHQTTDSGIATGSQTETSGNGGTGQQAADASQPLIQPGEPDANQKAPLPGTTEPVIDVEPPKGTDPNKKDPDPGQFPLCDLTPARRHRRWFLQKRMPRGCNPTRSSSADDGPTYSGWGSTKGRTFKIQRDAQNNPWLYVLTSKLEYKLDTSSPLSRMSDSKVVGVPIMERDGTRWFFMRDARVSGKGKLIDYDATLERYQEQKAAAAAAEAAKKSKFTPDMEELAQRRREAAGSTYRSQSSKDREYAAMEHKLDSQMHSNAQARQEFERQGKIYRTNYQDVNVQNPGMNTINHGQTKPFYGIMKNMKNPSYEDLDSDWETHETYSTNPDRKGKRSSSPTIMAKEYHGRREVDIVNMQRYAAHDDRKYDSKGKRRADANSQSIPVFSQSMQRTVASIKAKYPGIKNEEIGQMISRFDGIAIENKDTLTSIDDSFRDVGADLRETVRFERRSSDEANRRGFQNIISAPNFRGPVDQMYQYPQYFRPSREISAIDVTGDSTGLSGGHSAMGSVIYSDKPGKQRKVYRGNKVKGKSRKRSEPDNTVSNLQSRNVTADPLQEWLEQYDMDHDYEEEPW